MSASRTRLAGAVGAVSGAALFGMLGPLARFAADAGVPGVAFAAWRALLGAAFVFILLLARGTFASSVQAVRALSGRGKAAFALAAATNAAVNMAVFTAFGLIPVALALMVLYTYPAGVVVVDLVTGRERPTWSRLAALALSTAGVALVLFGGMGAGVAFNAVGVLLSLFAAGAQVVYLMVNRDGYRTVPADAAIFVILAGVSAIAAAFAFLVGQGAGLLSPLTSPEAWPSLLIAGVAAAGLASILFLGAVRTIGGSRTGILMLFEPVMGVVLSAILLGEVMGPMQAVGGALVLAGALVLQVDAEPGLDPMGETAVGPVA